MIIEVNEWRYMDRNQLVNQSIDYIMQHLVRTCRWSRWLTSFFIRNTTFPAYSKAVTGESVYAFMKRCKVDQSAVDMKLNPEKSITDIGLDYGYSSSNYSSVFKKHHDASTSEVQAVHTNL